MGDVVVSTLGVKVAGTWDGSVPGSGVLNLRQLGKYAGTVDGQGQGTASGIGQFSGSGFDLTPVTVEVPAAYSAYATSLGAKDSVDETNLVGFETLGGVLWRCAWRFPLTQFSINDQFHTVQLRTNVAILNGSDSGTKTVTIRLYGTIGIDDPEADDAATMYTNCASSEHVMASAVSDYQSTGLQTVTFGMEASGAIVDALFQGSSFLAVAAKMDNDDQGDEAIVEFSTFSDPNAALRPTLIVNYTPAE